MEVATFAACGASGVNASRMMAAARSEVASRLPMAGWGRGRFPKPRLSDPFWSLGMAMNVGLKRTR
eukprot:10312775-Alexandrium_andersonii.AAC.1